MIVRIGSGRFDIGHSGSAAIHIKDSRSWIARVVRRSFRARLWSGMRRFFSRTIFWLRAFRS